MGDAFPVPSPLLLWVASFVVSVRLRTLSEDGFGVQLANDFVAVPFVALPAIGSEEETT